MMHFISILIPLQYMAQYDRTASTQIVGNKMKCIKICSATCQAFEYIILL